jgi:tripartite-type tricarboxylate transporter receptor subunit TctC
MFISLGVAMPHIRAGRLRAIGASGARRFEAAPELPTLAEQGITGFEASSWQGVLGPAGMPEPVRDRIHRALGQALTNVEVVRHFNAAGANPEPSSPQDFGQYIRDETIKWARLINAKGIRLDT